MGLENRAPFLARNLQIAHSGGPRDAKEISHFDYLRATVAAKPQKIVVASDDVFRPSVDRAFENAIVGRIFLDDIQLLGGDHFLGKVGHSFTEQCDRLRRPLELDPQDARHPVNNLVGNLSDEYCRRGPNLEKRREDHRSGGPKYRCWNPP